MRRVLPLVLLAVAGCYLPEANTTLPVENQVQVAVYRCTPDLVSGDILNNAATAIEITIKAKWLDASSAVLHEADAGPFEVPAKGVFEWEVEAGDPVEAPAQCLGETVTVSEAGS